MRNLVKEYEQLARDCGIDLKPSNSHSVWSIRSKPPIFIKKNQIEIPAHLHELIFGTNKDAIYTESDTKKIRILFRCFEEELGLSMSVPGVRQDWWNAR